MGAQMNLRERIAERLRDEKWTCRADRHDAIEAVASMFERGDFDDLLDGPEPMLDRSESLLRHLVVQYDTEVPVDDKNGYQRCIEDAQRWLAGRREPTLEDVEREAKRAFGEKAYVTDPYDHIEAWPSYEDWWDCTVAPMVRAPTLEAVYAALRAIDVLHWRSTKEET